ncbi:MAG: sugar phosphate isomerase/epimerase family protein [Ferruginibacter sp.]
MAKADSADVKFAEGFMFSKTGPELRDSMITMLSPAGIEKLSRSIKAKGMQMVSFYVMGGNTVDSWKKQFELAKRFKVKYVTSEPPVDMRDSIDSLAGVYHIKVAIHNHWKGTSRYWHPDSVLAALKGHPNFGVCADVGHWPKSGINPVEGLKKLKGHIIALHLKDIAAYNDPTLKDVVVGTGIIDFPEVFKELKRQNFSGYIMIERDAEEQPSNLPSVMQEIKYYKRQMQKL